MIIKYYYGITVNKIVITVLLSVLFVFKSSLSLSISVNIENDTGRINYFISRVAKSVSIPVVYSGIDLLNFRSGKIVYNDIWTSLTLAQNAEKLSARFGYKKGLADAFINKAIVASVEGEYTESIHYTQNAFSIYHKMNDTTGMIKSLYWLSLSYCYGNVQAAQNTLNKVYKFKTLRNYYDLYADIISIQSFIYYLEDEYDKALKNLDVSLGIASAVGDQSRLAQYYHRFSMIYSKKGEYDLSMNYSIKALKIFIDHSEYINITKVLNKIGSLLIAQDDYYNAARVFSVESILLRKFNIKRSWASYYIYLYQINKFQKNFNEAIKDLKQAYHIQKSLNDTLNFSLALGNIASLYTKHGELDTALTTYKTILNIQNKIGYNFGKASTLSDIGLIYNQQKKYQQAIAYLELSDSCLKNDNDNDIMLENYEALSRAYIQLKDYPKACYYLKQYNTQLDTFSVETARKQINGLMLKYQSQEKDYKIKNLSDAKQISDLVTKREELVTTVLIIILVMLSALFFLIYLTYKQRQKNKYQNLVNETQRNIANAILDAQDKERNVIGRDLHDSIGSMVATAKLNLSGSMNENTEKIKQNISSTIKDLDQVIKELREVARNLMTDVIAESGIQHAIQQHVDKVNQAQSGIKFRFISFGDFSKMNRNSQITLYKIFLELTNNCIKYSKATESTIEITELEDHIIFTMEDNGTGFELEKNFTKGSGLKNINYRVTLLGGKCQFDSSIGNGTNISIEIPKAQ